MTNFEFNINSDEIINFCCQKSQNISNHFKYTLIVCHITNLFTTNMLLKSVCHRKTRSRFVRNNFLKFYFRSRINFVMIPLTISFVCSHQNDNHSTYKKHCILANHFSTESLPNASVRIHKCFS